MNRLILSASVLLAMAAIPSIAADADVAFKLPCTSTSTQMLPKGNAGAGAIAPVKGVPVEDLRKYIYYRGECKAA